jgi:hypothetical protein
VVVEALATASGERGSMAEYLRSTIEHLEARGIHDRYLWRMQEQVADRLERGRNPLSGAPRARSAHRRPNAFDGRDDLVDVMDCAEAFPDGRHARPSRQSFLPFG